MSEQPHTTASATQVNHPHHTPSPRWGGPGKGLFLVLLGALVYVSVQWRRALNTPAVEAGITLQTPAEQGTGQFQEVDVTKTFTENPFTLFKGAGLLLAAGDSTGYNTMTIGWGAVGNLWRRAATMTVYVAPARHTFGFMNRTKYFTVMAFDEEHHEVLNYMGSHSGRDGDKAAALGLTPRFTPNGAPYFEEASVVYECRLIYHAPFQPSGFGDVPADYYAQSSAGIHSEYIGEIVRVMRK